MDEIGLIVILSIALLGVLFLLWQQREGIHARTLLLRDKDRLIATLEENAEDKALLLNTIESRESEKDQLIVELRAQVAAKSQEIEAAAAQLADYDQRVEQMARQMNYERALTLTLANAAYGSLVVVNHDHEIIAINNAAEELFGRQRPIGEKLDAVTGLPELAMMVDDALTEDEESFESQIVMDNKTYRVRSQMVRRDGHAFVALALQDITQLVRLNRARRDMVANISHELRTPIANIRLIIDGLFHDADKPKRKDSIHSLRAIARESDNLLWLVQEMSDLSMIESGQAIVRLVENPLVDVVDEAVERMADQSEQKDIKIVSHIPDRMNVLCDRDLIQRVLVNLIHNALKWSPKKETITVTATNGGDEVTISVLDNGPGVPEDSVDRIFERFYQVDVSRSGHEGTGLGLAICRHIVEAHGGRIWAEPNTEGGGGRFLFTLLNAGETEAEVEAEEAGES